MTGSHWKNPKAKCLKSLWVAGTVVTLSDSICFTYDWQSLEKKPKGKIFWKVCGLRVVTLSGEIILMYDWQSLENPKGIIVGKVCGLLVVTLFWPHYLQGCAYYCSGQRLAATGWMLDECHRTSGRRMGQNTLGDHWPCWNVSQGQAQVVRVFFPLFFRLKALSHLIKQKHGMHKYSHENQ